jgi:hypothetical protein
LKTSNLKTARKSKSLDYNYIGPFEILEQVNEMSFKLKLPESMSKFHDTFHASLLEPYVENTIPARHVPPPPPIAIDDENESEHEEYEVEEILAKKKVGKGFKYLVHWKGYGIDDRTWEPASSLKHCKEAVHEFESKQRI